MALAALNKSCFGPIDTSAIGCYRYVFNKFKGESKIITYYSTIRIFTALDFPNNNVMHGVDMF